MKPIPTSFPGRLGSLVMAFLLLGGYWGAAASANPLKPTEPEPEKRFKMEFDRTPWPKVLEWVSEETGLTLLASAMPRGTFTILSPKGCADYTIHEVFDILNDSLMPKGLILLRRTQTFAVIALKEATECAPFITLAGLDECGKTDFVKVSIPVKMNPSDAVLEDLKKLLGPYGGVQSLNSVNQLIVRDQARHARRIVARLKELDLLEQQ